MADVSWQVPKQSDVEALEDITKKAYKRWEAELTTDKQGQTSLPDYDFTNLGLLFPINDATEIAYIQSPAPTDWVAGTTIYPSVVVRQEYDLQAVFKIDYKILELGEAVPSTWTTYTMETYKDTYVSGSTLNVLNGGAGIDWKEIAKQNGLSPEEFTKEIFMVAAALGAMELDREDSKGLRFISSDEKGPLFLEVHR